MPRLGPRAALGAAALALLAACGGSEEGERQSVLRTIGLRQPAPDEFLVVERRPLVLPGSYTELPPPQPEGTNRVDPQPRDEVVALLGGAPAAARATSGTSAGTQALLSSTGAGATDPAIRRTVDAEDAVTATEGSGQYGLNSIFGRRLNDPYQDDVLDANAELERLRAEGVAAPAAPPPPPPRSTNSIRLF